MRFAALALSVLLPATSFAAEPLAEADRALARELFKELIEINTTHSAGDTTAAAEAMAKRLRAAGFPRNDVAVLGPRAKRGNLVARLRGSGKTRPVLVIVHLDVVEARREDWTTDPFQFVEKDGYFYGRGTQDIKDMAAIATATLIRFKREGFVPERDIILALTADEESGADNGVDWLLKNHRGLVDAEFVLNPDSGGVDSVGGKPVNLELAGAEKIYADYELAATNPGGHSSQPRPENAIYQLTAALGRVQRSPFPFELNPVTRGYFEHLSRTQAGQAADDMRAILGKKPDAKAVERLSKDPAWNSTLHTTCVATRLAGGHANNALPQSATAIVNCRILPGHSPEEVRRELIKIVADKDITVRYVHSKTDERLDFAPDTTPMAPPPLRQDVLDSLRRTVDARWPGLPIIPTMMTGASDSVFTVARGIPTYGFSGVAVDRDDVRAHGKDERLRVEAYYEGAAFWYDVLKDLTAPR
ncbi:MAG: M20/M25/M40 family metallo-hydrolase [Gammaproteobacteria bacterium]